MSLKSSIREFFCLGKNHASREISQVKSHPVESSGMELGTYRKKKTQIIANI